MNGTYQSVASFSATRPANPEARVHSGIRIRCRSTLPTDLSLWPIPVQIHRPTRSVGVVFHRSIYTHKYGAPELLPNHVNFAGRHLPVHILMSMKITDVNMETDALANHINLLPMHSLNSSMKATDVNMEIEALANHIRLTRRGEGEGTDVGNKKTKKKIFRVPQEELDDILSFQLPPAWPSLGKRCPSLVGELEKMKESFLAEREKMRREYQIMGYATYEAEVTDDDDDEEDTLVAIPAATSFHGEKDDAAATSSPWIIPRGRGRKRFRPGVVKQASGVKKIT
ncbi:uncharacterized protein [Aegilops tauschii subsp. strangulata]|uniref:uncharacterized protein n=1 Tax=Aegilops tauschii subsp. strangulata TaxID=200361 RepID=UPI003CC8CF98